MLILTYNSRETTPSLLKLLGIFFPFLGTQMVGLWKTHTFMATFEFNNKIIF